MCWIRWFKMSGGDKTCRATPFIHHRRAVRGAGETCGATGVGGRRRMDGDQALWQRRWCVSPASPKTPRRPPCRGGQLPNGPPTGASWPRFGSILPIGVGRGQAGIIKRPAASVRPAWGVAVLLSRNFRGATDPTAGGCRPMQLTRRPPRPSICRSVDATPSIASLGWKEERRNERSGK